MSLMVCWSAGHSVNAARNTPFTSFPRLVTRNLQLVTWNTLLIMGRHKVCPYLYLTTLSFFFFRFFLHYPLNTVRYIIYPILFFYPLFFPCISFLFLSFLTRYSILYTRYYFYEFRIDKAIFY